MAAEQQVRECTVCSSSLVTMLCLQTAATGSGPATGGDGGGEKPQQQRKWKDWMLEKETELRLEIPDQDVSAIDIKVNIALLISSLISLS